MKLAPPPQRIALIAGTRPNFIKAAPLFHALQARKDLFDPVVWVVSQHQAPELVDETLEDLALTGAQVRRLKVGEGKLGERLGAMVDAIGEALEVQKPTLAMVFGDVDTTLAGAIAAKRAHILLAHVEAGLRSRDRAMPEELNRLMVDAISDIFFTTSQEAFETLVLREGQPATSVRFVGNLMIDSLHGTTDIAHGEALCRSHGVIPGQFALATFHRPSNVDGRASLEALLSMLQEAASVVPVLLPLHPRTASALKRHRLSEMAERIDGLTLLPPLRYRDFVSVLACARIVLTDSGGLQEESSVLGVPCLTVRGNTERPETIWLGSNRLVDPEVALPELKSAMASPRPIPASIPGWDGCAAARIIDFLVSRSSDSF
jgi:UDP-N-acetylglucosamine 2-epimerase (non-hydrolysing)